MNLEYNIENILTSLNRIEKRHIIPTNVSQKICRQQSNFNQFESSDIPYLPLEWFDSEADVDYDRRYFEERSEGFAFLPAVTATTSTSAASKASTSSSELNFEWHKVFIKAYNNESNKWHIEDVSNGENYQVPRICLMFVVENPQKFLRRIQNAIQHREKCECNLRFEAILNEFPMNRIPYPFVYLHGKIEKLLLDNNKMNKTKTELMEFYQRESCIVFQKFHIAQQLIKFINERKSNSEYLKQQKKIELPRKLHFERNFLSIECQNNNNDCLRKIYNRKESVRNFKQLWLHCCPQSIKIMEFINNECDSVSRMSFFQFPQDTPVSGTDWMKFRVENNLSINSLSLYLKSKWIDRIVCEIQSQLADVGKGWFDINNINNWSTYKMSKLYRLIQLIKKRMEISIMKLLKSSLGAFVNHLCRPCECLLNISNDYEWMDDDLVNSPFHTSNFIFKIFLNIDSQQKVPIYSISDLQNGRFGNDILGMYYKCILITHNIPQIDPYLMKKLKFDVKNLKLSSIGLHDADIQNQILQLKESYSKCLIPLYAYARKYEKFIKLKCLDVQLFVDSKVSKLTAHDIEKEIYGEIKLYDELMAIIPNDIVIGPFLIDIQELKSSLMEKRMEIIKALKKCLVMTAKRKVETIQVKYDEIMDLLIQKPLTIEHLDGIRKWIPSVPQKIQILIDEMKLAAVDFRIIDSFWMALSDEMFSAKWKVLQMPQIVNCQINETKKQHEIDTERFRKMHESDVTVFNEKFSVMAQDIDEFLSKKHPSSADEMLNLWASANCMRERCQLLNRRSLIFNQPEIDMELLNDHIEHLHPYQIFWTMKLNFLSSRQIWTEEMPLSMLDIQSIEAEIKRYDMIIINSREFFDENEKMMETWYEIFKEVEEFKELFSILTDIRSPILKDIHLNNMTKTTGIYFSNNNVTLKDLSAYGVSRLSKILAQTIEEAIQDSENERKQKLLQEIEEEKERQRNEEIRKHRELRRLARKDLFS